ncbi:hypothetical protein [Rhizobium lusitanum]|uniref:Uncharacterized protein n=1 Tax=Rhizobium lusitanum TaxID=293958 RepID=A0A7X0IKZ2_9HYPH|nr:hypothetical protein [Rhizobium lusitanum]MBB6482895.1 hypothetical protein [Rhizobium lusitanum]
MLKQTLSTMRSNPAFYAMFIIGSVAVAVFDEYSKKSTATSVIFFLSALLVMNVQNSVLRGQNFTTATRGNKLPFGGYMFRSFVLALLAFILMVPALILLLRGDGSSKAYIVIWATLAYIATFSIILSLLGTWLPAKIQGTNATMGDALRRGLARFPSTVLLVLLGLAMPLVATFIAAMVEMSFSSVELIVDGHLNIYAILLALAANAFQAVGWTYVAVLLTRRYMEAEHIGPSPGAELLKVFT